MKPTIALLAAIILCPMAAAAEPAPSPAQARVLGGIPDGTPPPPAPPKPPFTVAPSHILDSSIKREGGRNVLVQRIAPLALPPPPAPEEYPTAISPEAFRAKLAAYRALHPRPLLVGIGATVYRAAGKPTLTRITSYPLDGKSGNRPHTFWSTADFSLLAGLGAIADAEGRTYDIFMMWGVIDLDRNNASRRARGLADLPYPTPTLRADPAGAATFIAETAAPSPNALNPVKALHEIHNRDFSALLAARERREQARAAREQWLKANPPQPKDIILNHWDLGESRPLTPPPVPPAIPARSRPAPRRRSPRRRSPKNRKPKAGIQNAASKIQNIKFKIQNPLLPAILILTTLALTAPHSLAILDLDGNGISDIVEQAWNGGTPPAQPYDPAANPDGDLWHNALEATAGTDPFSGDPAINGFLTPSTEFVPAVYGDEDGDGIDEVITPETLLLTWTSVPGKAYQVFFSSTLAADSRTEVAWTELDPPRIAVGTQLGKAIPLTQANGAKPDKLFFRIAVFDVDSDFDNLSDAEEELKGTDPLKPDTDADGVRDYDELAETQTNPLQALDLDTDGIPDDLEKHLARQFLAVHSTPAYWGAFYAALLTGDLDPTHDYSSDNLPIGDLVPSFIAMGAFSSGPPSPLGSDLVLMEPQSRKNSLSGSIISNPPGGPQEDYGTYTHSLPGGGDSNETLTSENDLVPSYLSSRIGALTWTPVLGATKPLTIYHSLDYLIGDGESWFDSNSQGAGAVLYSGEISQRRFRLLAAEIHHPPVTYHYVIATTSEPFDSSAGEQLVSTETFTLSIPDGATASNWVEFSPQIANGTITRQRVIHIAATVDVNRDGLIHPYASYDTTSPAHPYDFWANDDCDDGHDVDDGDWEEDDIEIVPPMTLPGEDQTTDRDCWTPRISCRRDLEDFSRLTLDLSGAAQMLDLSDPDLKLCCYQTPGDPSTENPPYITLFQAVDPDGGTGYLTDNDTGYNQIESDFGQWLRSSNSHILPDRAWRTPGIGGRSHFIFECGENPGPVTVTFRLEKNGATLIEFPPVYINIKPVNQMYETWTVGDVTLPWQEQGASLASTATQTTGQNLPVPQTDEEKDYILFVHGWNMPPWEKTAFADTMFKRLWHQGYKGRFGAFRWPTYWDFHGSPTALFNLAHFDNSEVIAWQSASRLKVLIEDRAAVFHVNGTSKVRLYAHSMGNVVASECLRQFGPAGAPVQTYIAAQAALSSHVWDAATPAMQFNPPLSLSTPDVYAHYWLQGQPDHHPQQWVDNNTPSYMAPQYMPGNTAFINHYNPFDWALSYDKWQRGQALKPDNNYRYSVPLWDDYEFHQRFWTIPNNNLICPADRYETFSYAAQSHGYATGQQGNTGGKFDPIQTTNVADYFLTSEQIQAGVQAKEHKYHSGQFRSSIQKRWTYWKQALRQMETLTPNP